MKMNMSQTKRSVLRRNSFVEISSTARRCIIAYFLIWRILPAIVHPSNSHTADNSIFIALSLTGAIVECLLLLPFLGRRFAGSAIGWCHPLILPTVVTVLFGLLKNPSGILAPFIAPSASDSMAASHFLLVRPSIAQLKINLVFILALLGTYSGFALMSKFWKGRLKIRPAAHLSGYKMALLFLTFSSVVLIFLQERGGIISHMATFSLGRARSMGEFSGPVLIITAFLPYFLVFWYLFRPKYISNPIFLCAMVCASALQFIVEGSRSSMFQPWAVLLGAWMLMTGKLPALQVVVVSIAILLLLGVLGDVRRGGTSDGYVDFSSLTEMTAESALEKTRAEFAERSIGMDLIVAEKVPSERGYLWGKTYLAAVGFWVPQFVWPQKPRGAGAHASALLLKGHQSMDGYVGGGVPPGAHSEAYWNFGWLGPITVFFLYGCFLRFCAEWITVDQSNPAALMLLLLCVFVLRNPATVSMVAFFQILTLLFFTMKVALTSRRRTQTRQF